MAAPSEQNSNGLKPNKPGEPNFKLPIEPIGPIVFKREGKLCYAKKVLENNTDKKVVFKVKVTNRVLFRVNKAVDVLAAGAPLFPAEMWSVNQVNIRIFYSGTPEEALTYFVAFYHADIPEAAAAKKDSEIWKEVQPAGVMRITCAYEKEEGKEKKEVKKEEEKKKEKKEEEKKESKKEEAEKEAEPAAEKQEERKEEKKEEDKEEKKEEEKNEEKEDEKKEPPVEKQEEKKDAADEEKNQDIVKGGEKEEKKEDEACAANPEKDDEKKADS